MLILLPTNVDKIIEKIMHKRIMQFLNEHTVLYQKQFSTTHAMIKLIEDIEKSLDNKESVCAVFTDLQKAFDTVDHNIFR